MDETQGLVLAKAAGCQAGYTWDDPVIAARDVEVHTQKGLMTGLSCFPLKFFEEYRRHGVFAWETTKLSWV
jgi:hypothetical protein